MHELCMAEHALRTTSRAWVICSSCLGVQILHVGVCHRLPAAAQPGDLRRGVRVWVSALRGRRAARNVNGLRPKACDDGVWGAAYCATSSC